MALTPSRMLSLGTIAPPFSLPEPRTGETVALDDFSDAKALLVVFMCNHCPYVVFVREELAQLGRDMAALGVAMVGINSNDIERFAADSPDAMVKEAHDAGYEFPYLLDESQAVAQAYMAACTPDFYLFDGERILVYRGQLDDSRPGNGKSPNGADIRAAVDAVLGGTTVSTQQKPSIGCNIKWKPGNAGL